MMFESQYQIQNDTWQAFERNLCRLLVYEGFENVRLVGHDAGLAGNLDYMKTWKFNFKNCKYNGVKVTENNFGEKNQVFYLYNVGNTGAIADPVANGLILNFE